MGDIITEARGVREDTSQDTKGRAMDLPATCR